MFSSLRKFALIASISWAASCAQAGPPPEVTSGVLVLRNGNVLEGRITRAPSEGERGSDGGQGDRIVSWSTGSVRVAAAEIDLVCRDIDEAYHQKRRRIENSTTENRIRLARWCINQKLYGYAARELLEARSVEPDHPALDMLEQRILLATKLSSRVARKPTAKPFAVLNSELDKLAGQIPEGSLSRFTKETQLILANHCATSGCHGPRSDSSFRMERISRSRPAGQRATQRNLYAVLQTIRRDDPAQSPLLIEPIRPHGGLKAPVFTQRNARQYLQLISWVQGLEVQGQRAEVETKRPEARGQRSGTAVAGNLSSGETPIAKGAVPKQVAAQRGANAKPRKAALRKPYEGASFLPWQVRELKKE